MLTLALVVAALALVVTVGDTVAPSDEPRMEFENGNVSFSDGDAEKYRVVETGDGSFETVEVTPSGGSIDVEVREYASGDEVVSAERNASPEYEVEFDSEYRLEPDDGSDRVTVRRVPTDAKVVSNEAANLSVSDEFEAEVGEAVEIEVETVETENLTEGENEEVFFVESNVSENRSPEDEDG